MPNARLVLLVLAIAAVFLAVAASASMHHSHHGKGPRWTPFAVQQGAGR